MPTRAANLRLRTPLRTPRSSAGRRDISEQTLPRVSVCSCRIAVSGNGDFTPAHLVGGTAVYVVQSIDATFTFTPTGGEPQTQHLVRSKGNVKGDTATCTFELSETAPEGTFTASGTVVVFITPKR